MAMVRSRGCVTKGSLQQWVSTSALLARRCRWGNDRAVAGHWRPSRRTSTAAGRLSHHELRSLLGFTAHAELDGFLKARGIFDLDRERQTLGQLGL